MIRGALYGALSNEIKNSIPLTLLKALEKLKKDNALQITRTDKSNAVVIMNKSYHKDKVCDLQRDTNTVKSTGIQWKKRIQISIKR